MNEILLYGPIGPDFWEPENAITAKSVMSQLSEISGDVTVRISSGGGDVYEGIDIMTALKNHDGKVTVIVESLAASAASFIAVGGADRVLMRPSSEMMVHRAWSLVEGNADDARKALGDLERQDNKLAAIYAGKAGGEIQDWLDAMSAETWYTAEEAVAAGLADGVITEKSEAPTPSASLAKRRFKFANRAAAPPPPVTRSESGDNSTKPSDGQEGDAMSIKNLAQELGVEPDVLREKLSGFFNEEVTVTATVDLTYPENNTVVPTGEVQVAPNEDVPAGVTFELAGTPDGWTGEIAEDTGVLKVTAPTNVEPDTEVQFTVAVNGGSGEPVELTVPVTVKAAANTEEETTQETAPETSAPAEDTITLDAETYAELKAAAQHGWKAMEQQKEASLVAEVDGWIKEGRISAARRTKAIAAMKRDPEAARDIYGSNPAGTIPRAEIGYGKDAEPDEGKTVRDKADKVGFLTRKNFH
ncbi:head maturation protease, ClpP-related [Corynebacterium sp. MSK158]|uniref:head maturation protease, ClpP-related n=1 Tax=Corynebacterium sp. MSK158 TaxID=3050212 RepID=UPI00254AA275|nr:head maturation protease, ClpP-related [Corynebacterium sp. MSK158]MDK8693587.1 ATP-dependent Clp protease proteolytic subunit [Corynebacterium sp. MSK158]